MMEVGRIEFGNTREGNALRVLHDAFIDKAMWMQESFRKDEEIAILRCEIVRLKKLLKGKHGKQIKG